MKQFYEINFFYFFNNLFSNKLLACMGIGDWGLGIGPNPQSPIPNPQSPIPNPHLLIEENK